MSAVTNTELDRCHARTIKAFAKGRELQQKWDACKKEAAKCHALYLKVDKDNNVTVATLNACTASVKANEWSGWKALGCGVVGVIVGAASRG